MRTGHGGGGKHVGGGGHRGGCGPDGPQPLKGKGGGRFEDGAVFVCDTCGESVPAGPNAMIAFAMSHAQTHPKHHGIHLENPKKC